MIEARRMILLVTAPGAVSNNLVFALEREFPWAAVEWVGQVDAVSGDFAYPVALILVDPEHLPDMERIAADILKKHPAALVAAIEPDAQNPVCDLAEIDRSSLVRSVLPMNLKLDIWLSIVGLMLRGGEYFPATMFHSYVKKMEASPSSGMEASSGTGGAPITDLTPREMQILGMVSRGLQNKQIAAEFNLSENTVKIHLHHIIRKLGIHNRTEAAARFRDFEASR